MHINDDKSYTLPESKYKDALEAAKALPNGSLTMNYHGTSKSLSVKGKAL